MFRLSGLKNALLVLVHADSSIDGSANMRIKLWGDAYRIFVADHFPFRNLCATQYLHKYYRLRLDRIFSSRGAVFDILILLSRRKRCA